jgi:hypothetical protein
VVSYSAFHKYIVTNLCEKRDAPQNHCDGKCWLKKELNRTEERGSNQLPTSRFEIPQANYIAQVDGFKIKEILAIGNFRYGNFLIQFQHSGFIASVFHPPEQ